jgi:cell division protein ZapA
VSDDTAPVSVRILDKEYQVACPAGERDNLMRCAELLNTRMREIRDSGKIIGLDRIAVMAALNISHELIRANNADDKVDDNLGDRMRSLREKVESALENGQQLEL